MCQKDVLYADVLFFLGLNPSVFLCSDFRINKNPTLVSFFIFFLETHNDLNKILNSM